MSRGYTPRHAQMTGDLSFAVQFNDETALIFELDRAMGPRGWTHGIFACTMLITFYTSWFNVPRSPLHVE